jgi:hypothetical protein
MSNIASYFQVKSKTLQKHYKHQVSGYHQWEQKHHAEDYLIFPENITDSISIDEVSLYFDKLSNHQKVSFILLLPTKIRDVKTKNQS